MNNYYGNRLVKFVSPQCDKVFSLELGGEEIELKDLIATILNIPISDLKGIKDTHNNYYTFSSAIKNKQLTSSYSKYYTIVLGNTFNHHNYQLRQWPTNNYAHNQPQTLEPMKLKISPMIYDQGDKVDQILNKLLKGNYIEEKTLIRIKQLMTEESNQEMLMLFHTYDGYDLKLLAEKALRITNNQEQDQDHDQEKSYNKSQLITYSDILDSLEDHFDDKKDIVVLKRLLSFDNEHIIKVFHYYEENCDMLNLVDNLNQMILLYKDKFKDIQYAPSTSNTTHNHQVINDEEYNKAFEDEQNAEAKAKQIKANRELLIKQNYDTLYLTLPDELKALLAYAKHSNENYVKLFQIEEPLEEKDNKLQAIASIKRYYEDFMQNNVYLQLSKPELDTYNQIINDNDRNQPLKKAFEVFQSDFDVKSFKDNVVKYIKEQMPQEKITRKTSNTIPIKEQKTINKIEVTLDDDYVINNKKKEKSTITLKFQNSINISPQPPGHIDKVANINKKQSEELSTASSTNKKLQEFTKVINTLSIEEQHKTKILQLLSDKDAKVMKIYESFLKNKMSLTKNVIINVIQQLNDNNSRKEQEDIQIKPANDNKNNPTQTNKPSSSNKNNKDEIPTSASTFDSVIVHLEKQKVISPGESSFIIKRYQNNDEMILSIYEVFKASDGELPDFIDSLQTFISKHHSKTTNLPEPMGAKTPISITNTKKEILNLFRSNEKSEMNKIKNKQKQIISLLLKENLIEPSNYDFFNMKIEAEDQMISSVFEVFSVARDHRDFVETLNLIKDIMYNKDSVGNDPLAHQKNILNELFEKSKFNQNEKEIIVEGLKQNDQTILSAIELFEAESDVEEALDTLEIFVKSKMKNKRA